MIVRKIPNVTTMLIVVLPSEKPSCRMNRSATSRATLREREELAEDVGRSRSGGIGRRRPRSTMRVGLRRAARAGHGNVTPPLHTVRMVITGRVPLESTGPIETLLRTVRGPGAEARVRREVVRHAGL